MPGDFMEENYILAKKTVSSKYLDSKYYPLLVLSMFVFLEKYPDFKSMIIGLFEHTDIIIEEDKFTNILKNNKISYLPLDIDEEDYVTSGISSSGRSVSLKNGELILAHENPIIICSSFGRTKEELLNIFIHEMNHLIKGSLNSFYFHKKNNNTFYAYRTGLGTHYCRYDHNTGDLLGSDEYVLLDEVINTIQATELTQNIFILDGVIDDLRIQEYIDSLNKLDTELDFGYEEATRIFRPLWENNNFSKLVEDNIVAGDISNIIDEYEAIVGEDSLSALSIALGIINEADLKQKYGKKYKMAKKYVKKCIKKFSRVKRKVLV